MFVIRGVRPTKGSVTCVHASHKIYTAIQRAHGFCEKWGCVMQSRLLVANFLVCALLLTWEELGLRFGCAEEAGRGGPWHSVCFSDNFVRQ